MISMFIDTSTSDVSIAFVQDDRILSQIKKCIPNEHSVYTVSFLDQCLKDANLTPDMVDCLFVVNGPGSFTGVRIGVTIAKTYAYLLQKKIIPVSALKMRVLGLKGDYFLSLIDAKHGNYYMGLYDSNYNEVIPEQFCTSGIVQSIILQYQPKVVSDDGDIDVIEVVSYYQKQDGVNVHLINPNYLKLPQAVEELHDSRS